MGVVLPEQGAVARGHLEAPSCLSHPAKGWTSMVCGVWGMRCVGYMVHGVNHGGVNGMWICSMWGSELGQGEVRRPRS